MIFIFPSFMRFLIKQRIGHPIAYVINSNTIGLRNAASVYVITTL